jgi:hypothetical protein
MCVRLWNDYRVAPWKLLFMLSFLAKHDRAPRMEGANLPVDMEHLRLEERGDILRSDGTLMRWHGKQRRILLDAMPDGKRKERRAGLRARRKMCSLCRNERSAST